MNDPEFVKLLSVSHLLLTNTYTHRVQKCCLGALLFRNRSLWVKRKARKSDDEIIFTVEMPVVYRSFCGHNTGKLKFNSGDLHSIKLTKPSETDEHWSVRISLDFETNIAGPVILGSDWALSALRLRGLCPNSFNKMQSKYGNSSQLSRLFSALLSTATELRIINKRNKLMWLLHVMELGLYI